MPRRLPQKHAGVRKSSNGFAKKPNTWRNSARCPRTAGPGQLMRRPAISRGAVLPEPVEETDNGGGYSEPLQPVATDGGNAPTAEAEQPADLTDIREELRRRNED